MDDLDRKIDGSLNAFRKWFSDLVRDQDWKTKRRLGGVCLLGDIQAKSLDELPFVLDGGERFVRSSKTVTISTDGAVATQGRKKGKDQGPGGWAFVVHDTDEERSGNVNSSTNNQMELRAVIEAIKFVGCEKSIVIRTDSQYVHDAVNRQNIIKSNSDLWKEFEDVRRSRRIKIVWVKGHAGDAHNERADKLASQQANIVKAKLCSQKK